jgi:hypothetical protein
MPTVRKIFILNGEQMLNDHPSSKARVVISHPDSFHDESPRLILYRARGEKIVQGPKDILELLRAEGVVQEGTTRARNPITHGQYSCVVSLAQSHDTLIALSAALIPALIAWLRGRKGRRIELQKGDMKISAPNAKALDAALKSLAEYEKFTIVVNKAKSKRKKQSSKRKEK